MWKIKHLLKNSKIFSTELFVLPTTALKIMLGRLPEVLLKELQIKMVEINTPMLLLTLKIIYLLWMSLVLPSGISLWTKNWCFIYWSSGKRSVGNCDNDWPYGFFRDTCLQVVMTIAFLIFYYFIAVPIEGTCSRQLTRFNNCIFYMLFYFTADLEQIFYVLKF